eukprot:Hpha_TRINITY_DN16179_c3_g9::TRINITY_DN16179_c3_g9_i1::g.7977::m.7977
MRLRHLSATLLGALGSNYSVHARQFPAAMSQQSQEYYRPDGVRITHDPYAPGMAEKYGTPGRTDNEGFDPYRDTVGPGIYGGTVKREFANAPQEGGAEKDGHPPPLQNIPYGRQYQNHNPRPGPQYTGGGYTPVVKAVLGEGTLTLKELLGKHPDLSNDESTGGALPLHMCGMGGVRADKVETLVEFGADIEALDTYGMTPLHRMASNNLGEAAAALLALGADPTYGGAIGTSPTEMARSSRASAVLAALKKTGGARVVNPISKIVVDNSPVPGLNGVYTARGIGDAVPAAFARVCVDNGWKVDAMWRKLAGSGGGSGERWFQHSGHEGYIYYNHGDGQWWIDGPDGLGEYVAPAPAHAPPARGWRYIGKGGDRGERGVRERVSPWLRVFRERPGGKGGGEL